MLNFATRTHIDVFWGNSMKWKSTKNLYSIYSPFVSDNKKQQQQHLLVIKIKKFLSSQRLRLLFETSKQTVFFKIDLKLRLSEVPRFAFRGQVATASSIFLVSQSWSRSDAEPAPLPCVLQLPHRLLVELGSTNHSRALVAHNRLVFRRQTQNNRVVHVTQDGGKGSACACQPSTLVGRTLHTVYCCTDGKTHKR